jgi:hypothetical protein
MTTPPLEQFWSLVAKLQTARQSGQVPLLEAVEQVYPAEQAVAAVLAEEPGLLSDTHALQEDELVKTFYVAGRAGEMRPLRSIAQQLERLSRLLSCEDRDPPHAPADCKPLMVRKCVVPDIVGPCPVEARPRYALTQGPRDWTLVFDGVATTIKNKVGMLYLAQLLKHPNQPIPASRLQELHTAERQMARLSRQPAETLADARMAALVANDLESVLARCAELEGTLASEAIPEREKMEAAQELEDLREHFGQRQKQCKKSALIAAQAVRKAVLRLHRDLYKPLEGRARPDPVRAQFARHLERYLLGPSARLSARQTRAAGVEIRGSMVYEPPSGVVWS